MVIDDDPDIVTLLTYNLEQMGYSVTGVLNGEKALEMIGVVNPDLILLDLMLPGLNGHELLLLLKKNMRLHGIPVIVISAIMNKEVINKSLELKAAEYICKPFHVASLGMVIQRVLNN
jgi:DNA-binding response OmpR family regulator